MLKSGMRGRHWRVADLDAAVRRVADLAARTVIFDVEPLVAFWDTDDDTLRGGIETVLARTVAVGGVQVVGFATNSLRRVRVG